MKTLRKILLVSSFVSMSISISAQQDGSYEQEPTLLTRVSNIEAKQDKFNLFLNMNGSFDLNFAGSDFEQGKFNMRQIRIEAKGKLNDWLSYRYRQRLNRSNDGSDKVDNLPRSIDIAMIGVKLSDQFTINVGKQCAAYGGIEFDLNPIEIYEYSDMVEYMNNFLTGVNFVYTPIKDHEFQFQVLNSRNGSIVSEYGEANADVVDSKLPLVYTLNWNGNLNDVFKTRWSASIMSEAKGKKKYHYAFGNQLSLGKYGAFFDVMYSIQDLDRKGFLENYGRRDTEYLSFVLNTNYRITPKWNVFVQGMFENASFTKEHVTTLRTPSLVAYEKGKYRTSYGYMGGVEYYPMKSNLHFFLTYVGRKYDYTERASMNVDSSTNRVSVGFIYQLPMF